MKALMKSMWNTAYNSIRHPLETTIIERETGRVFERLDAWEKYLKREDEFPYSHYIVIGGMRRYPKSSTCQ